MSVHIGSISNTIYMSAIGQRFLNLSCLDCICSALMNSSIAWNCMTLNQSCILIQNYSSSDNGLISTNNSTFFFQEFPWTLTTTVSTSTKSTTTPSCTSQGAANLLTINGPLIWTLYKYNYTATHSTPTLSFVVHGGPASETVYLDDVSVTDNSVPSIQLLINPSFENSTTVVTSWIKECTSSCNTVGDGGNITTTGCHSGSGNNCYMNRCNGGYAYLSQTFSAINGHNYTVSFWLYKSNGGAGYFYANID